MDATKRKIAVVAIGGNSLIKDGKHKTVEDQYQAAKETTLHIADMIEAGWEVAVGHGNGPQVGFILRRSEIAARVEGMHEIPLDVCGADSQGRRQWPSAIKQQFSIPPERGRPLDFERLLGTVEYPIQNQEQAIKNRIPCTGQIDQQLYH